MSDKNLDVDRAIASVGGEEWVYHSFTPVLAHGVTAALSSSFTYNEYGEPEYKSALQSLPEASDYASPDDEYLEDAAYPEAHPGEVWNNVPAPENHVARFVAPQPQPVSSAPHPFPPAPAAPVAPVIFGATVAVARPGYVPFLPSTLAQSPVQAPAQLYRPAERIAALPSAPISPPIAAAPMEAAPIEPVRVVTASPASLAPNTIYRPAMPPAIFPTLQAPFFAAPPHAAATPLPAPVAAPAPALAPAPVAAPVIHAPALAPVAPPYPQPFGTLADMYARLASALPPPIEPVAMPLISEPADQGMFRRI